MELNKNLYNFQEKINNFLLWFKKNKKYKLNKGEIGINLGCEVETIPSFVGIDGSFLIYLIKNPLLPKAIKKRLYKKTWTSERHSFGDFVKKINSIRIIHHNILYGLPFKDNSIKFLFSCAFIEHVSEKNVLKIFKECFRVMKKKGKIRISVPDLDEEIVILEKKIKEYKKIRNEKLLQEYFTVPNFNSSFGFHRKIYNFERLKKLLEEVGFKNIQRFERFEGNIPKLKELDIRDGLMNVEGEK